MILHELVLDGEQSNSLELGEDGLLYKTILREGDFKRTPTDKGVVEKGFKVVGSGKSDPDKMVIAIPDLIESYNGKAFEKVTVPIGHPKTKEDSVLKNTGYIEKLVDGVDHKGRKVVKAGFNFTNKDAKERAEEGSIPGVSSGIFFNYTRGQDKKQFPVALNHVALTPTPFVTDMGEFSDVAAEDVDEVEDTIAYLFEDNSVDVRLAEDESGTVVWDGEVSYSSLRDKIQGLFSQVGERARRLGGEAEYYVQDISRDDKALVENIVKQERFIVPFSVEEDDITLASPEKWIEAKSVYVAASDDSQEDESERKDGDPTLPNVEAEETKEEEVKESFTISLSSGNIEEDARQSLNEARKARFDNKSGGNIMSRESEKIELKLENIPEEQAQEIRAAFEDQNKVLSQTQQENSELKAKDHEKAVEAEVEALKDIGLDNPGLLKFVRRVFVADDGQPSAVLASDDENKEEAVTASDVLRKFIEILPRNSEGNLELSEQGTAVEAGDPPPADTTIENDFEADRKAAWEVLESVGMEDYKKRSNKDGE